MVIKDLKETCSLCRGTGRLAGITSMGISQINAAGACHGCGGKGFLLTELGRDVVQLLRPFIAEMIAAARPPAAGGEGKKEDEA